MASWRTFLSATLIVAVAMAACGAPSTPADSPTPPPTASNPISIPTARVRAMDGTTEVELGSALQGRPALVTLWATWCDACRDELPRLNRVDVWAREHGAVVVGVAVGEPLARVSSFATANRVSYLVLVDEEFRFADAVGEKRIPSTLVVDRTGHIVYSGGAMDERALAAFRGVL